MKQRILMLRRQSREKGFSLAEVVVATAMLGVILLALFALLTSGVQRAYGGKKTTQATMIAQAVMEEANVYEPHLLFPVAATSTDPAVLEWERTTDATEPAQESGATSAITQRNAWRNLLATADLPASDEFPARLTVTATPLPEGASPARSFSTASLVRMEVRLTWTEWGTRPREVRLQSINLPVNP
jgi:Tfp pilus assembly protein PilV